MAAHPHPLVRRSHWEYRLQCITLAGRGLSALADSLSILLVFLTAQKLYNRRIALLTAALSSLAVLQIQQSHFMTVDNFAVLFSSAAMFSAAQIATTSNLTRTPTAPQSESIRPPEKYRTNRMVAIWYLAFGVAYAMAVASRINLLPLGGIVLVAAFIGIADIKLKKKSDLQDIFLGVVLYLFVFAIAALLTFKVAQPLSFRNPVGDTALTSFHLNPDWVNNMKLSLNESQGLAGGPPAEQWANRPWVFFPWMNMVVWGMGLPLGVAAWLGLLWAAWRVVRYGLEWRSHLLPLAWAGGFFLFMGTRWASSMRYFLPIYPFLILFAAWLLHRLFTTETHIPSTGRQLPNYSRSLAPSLLAGLVLGSTLIWAFAFVNAVYRQEHTRIQASKWIYANIPAEPGPDIDITDGSPGDSRLARPVIANESWDESLPLPVQGIDPSQRYTLLTMEVRWYDSENKRQMFLENLDQVDYIILPSQRAIWSASRIPLTYPMTMKYYQALFSGQLGFDLVATFTSPLKIGPLYISDVGGRIDWDRTPHLPLFNDNVFAAEEAFSVYDHPPVWIFNKRPDFNLAEVKSILNSVDLSEVVIQAPGEATRVR